MSDAEMLLSKPASNKSTDYQVLHILNGKGKSCRIIIIRDNTQFMFPILEQSFFDAIKTLVGLETLLIMVLNISSRI